MHSFYTIVSLSPNIMINDSVGIGIIFFNGKKFQSYFSENKRKISQRLIHSADVDLKNVVNQLVHKCEELNTELSENKLIYNSEKWINASYFEYLNKYSNGLIQFSKPKMFISSQEEKEFESLVRMLLKESLFESMTIIKEALKTNRLVQENLINRVSSKVHTNYKFKPVDFPAIHFNYELDCIGKNGALIGAKSLNFHQSEKTLDLKMSHYYSLILMLSSRENKAIAENSFYLFAEEPSLIKSPEHKLWESAEKNSLIKVLDPADSSRVADLIEEKKATQFL